MVCNKLVPWLTEWKKWGKAQPSVHKYNETRTQFPVPLTFQSCARTKLFLQHAISRFVQMDPCFKKKKKKVGGGGGGPPKKIGDAGYRSPYLSHAKRALYHLSYIPNWPKAASYNLIYLYIVSVSNLPQFYKWIKPLFPYLNKSI